MFRFISLRIFADIGGVVVVVVGSREEENFFELTHFDIKSNMKKLKVSAKLFTTYIIKVLCYP